MNLTRGYITFIRIPPMYHNQLSECATLKKTAELPLQIGAFHFPSFSFSLSTVLMQNVKILFALPLPVQNHPSMEVARTDEQDPVCRSLTLPSNLRPVPTQTLLRPLFEPTCHIHIWCTLGSLLCAALLY